MQQYFKEIRFKSLIHINTQYTNYRKLNISFQKKNDTSDD